MGQINISLNSQVAQSLQSVNSLVANVTNQFIVSSNNAPPGVNGFVFDIIDDEEMMLDADITDSWLETNSAIQDHIAIKPIKFTLRGFVGELIDIFQVQSPGTDSWQSVNVLPPLSAILPIWNSQDGLVYEGLQTVSEQAQTFVSEIQNVATLIDQLSPTNTRQQQAYVTFFGLWSNRTLCTIQTPFGLLTNMAIESVRALQSGKSIYVSDFSVTFKQIQTVGTSTTNPATTGNPNPSGSATQSSPQQTANNIVAGAYNYNQQGNAGGNGTGGTSIPSDTQSGILGSDASGRLGDNFAPAPSIPGANTSGVINYPGTLQPVSISNNIAQINQTLPIIPPNPQVNFGPPIVANGMEVSPLL